MTRRTTGQRRKARGKPPKKTRAGATMRRRENHRQHPTGAFARMAWLSILTALLTTSGCTRYRTIELSGRPAHTHSNRQEIHGLILSSELLFNPRAVSYHFGPELQTENFFPVVVYLENRDSRSFEIQRRNVEVILENGDRFHPVDELEVISEIERSYALAFVTWPLIIAPFLVYENTSTYNYDLANDFLRKAFPVSLRLEPGDPPQAYALFFRDTQTDRPRSDFQSSVLQARVDLDGTSPADHSDQDSKPPIVGEALLFTLSLLPGEVQ